MLSRNPVFRNPVIPTKNRNFRFSLTFNNKNILLTSNYNVNLIFVLYYKFLIQISCDNHIIFYVPTRNSEIPYPVYRDPNKKNLKLYIFNIKIIILTSNYNVNLFIVSYFNLLIQISCDNHIIFVVPPVCRVP